MHYKQAKRPSFLHAPSLHLALLLLLASALAALPLLAAESPYLGSPVQLPGVVQAENYDLGGEGVAWHDTTAGNVFGVYRADDMDVGQATDGSYFVGFLANGEWAKYTVNVPYTQEYLFNLRVASAVAGPNTFHIELDGVNVSGSQTIASTGDWNTYVVKSIPITLTAGNNRILRVVFDTGAWNFDYMDIRGNTPYLGSPVTLPGRLQAENYDLGGEGVSWHDTTPGNAFGVYRLDDMDVGPDGAGGYFVGNIANGEWAEYLVNVTAGGSYNLNVRYASAYTGATTFHILLNGTDFTGSQSITSTGGWTTFATKTIPVTVSAGNGQVLRISFDTGSWNLDYIELVSAACNPPVITLNPQTPSPAPIPGTSVTLSGAASNSPTYQWLKNGLPITGATASSLTITNVEQGKDGGSYTLKATNACGSATSAAAVIRVTCNESPDYLEENVNRALNGGTDLCDWTENLSTNFPYSYGGGQSYNKPVLAAAAALIREPIRSGTNGWNMYNWWTDYLRGELGDRGTVWFYGGQEIGSYVYQAYNISAVLAVHYQAQVTGQTAIRDLAYRWLRATFALHSLAAAPTAATTLHAQGQSIQSTNGYTGPYIAMAGERSGWGFWDTTDRRILLAQALGQVIKMKGEPSPQKGIRTFVEAHWSGPGGNVYGFTAAEQSELWSAVQSSTLPVNFVTKYLGTNLRAESRYHFVGWPGVKATLFERSSHTATAPTMGVVYFTQPYLAAGHEAHFLYPWQGVFVSDRQDRNGITPASGFIDVVSPTARYIRAINDGSPQHPQMTVEIDNLPLGTRSFWVVLSPDQPPAVQ